ncbi:MAG: hypothetical protein ABSA45_03210 [Verrucomicrobiota bacterium]|jgi:hypothetical protein
MKKFPWKQIVTILVLGVGVFVVVEMYKAYAAGKRAVTDILLAPWTALKAGWTTASAAVSNVVSGAAAVTQLRGLTQTALQNAQMQGSVAASYQPGGLMYNLIGATQGTDAANNAAQAAANNAATEQAQAQADASWWGLGNLWSYF